MALVGTAKPQAGLLTAPSLTANKPQSAPPAPDSTVLTTALETAAPSPGAEMLPWEPPLKPRKPAARIKAPTPVSWGQWELATAVG